MQPKTKATLCFGLIGRWVYTQYAEKGVDKEKVKYNLRRP